MSGIWPFIALSVVDRIVLIALFGHRFVSTDDAVVWHAAMDYSSFVFRGPYYYGQNYAPMLDALLAAPFHRWVPVNLLMPGITSLLALLPYWSFALWFQRQQRPAAALFMAILPLLMPVEFGAMTTMSRGFVTGAAMLALLPWTAAAGDRIIRPVIIGAICSLAWFVNPNTLVMTVPFVVHHIASHGRRMMRLFLVLPGSLAGIVAFLAAQHWCMLHPDRIIHRLAGTELQADMDRVLAGLSDLDAHFQWLMPLFWPYGGLLGVWLLALIPASFMRRDRALATALLAGCALVAASFTSDKVYDGWNSVFYPLSRMYLCLPLLAGWATARLLADIQVKAQLVTLLWGLCLGATAYRAFTTEDVTGRQIHAQRQWVGVSPVRDLQEDAHRLKRFCEKYDAGLIVMPFQLSTAIWPQFRAYLHPVLEPALPPTYLVGYERRYWVREAFADSVVPNIMIVGGDLRSWESILAMDARYTYVMDNGMDAIHILKGNTQPTDILVSTMLRTLAPWHDEQPLP